MAFNPGSYQANGRSGSEGSGKGRFGGHHFGQVSAQVLESDLSAHALAAFLCLTIRAAEETPLDEVRASPQDVANVCSISRKSASTALEDLELAGFVIRRESGEGKKARWKLNWHPAHIEADRINTPPENHRAPPQGMGEAPPQTTRGGES